jgi:hypothetical protein|eukprot:SAG25_NODE_714_length_5789_cov_9.025294_2_plen_207_part_00
MPGWSVTSVDGPWCTLIDDQTIAAHDGGHQPRVSWVGFEACAQGTIFGRHRMQPTATMPEPGPAPFSFRDFRARLKEPGAAQLMRELKVVISEFGAAPPEAGEHERVQEALGQLEQRMVGSGPWASASDQVLQGSREGLEKYLMTAIHGRAWLPREEEVELDRRLDTKVEALTGFITADHLDIPPCFHHDEAWGVARKELMRVRGV